MICIRFYYYTFFQSLCYILFLLSSEIFYVRNHLPVPEVDLKTYKLEVEVEGKEKCLCLTLDKLKKLPQHSISATVMCAGNRRSDMGEVRNYRIKM